MSKLNFVRNGLLSLAAAAAVLAVSGFQESAQAQLRCDEMFRSRDEITNIARDPTDPARRRRAVLGYPPERSPIQWLDILMKSGRLIRAGGHKYDSQSAFVASNEFDWHRTPFDNKPTDLMIAFGTNSAWEIAVNKSAGNLVMADWSPEPILAHAFVFTPLMRIAKTPQELLFLLSARTPDGANIHSVDLVLNKLSTHFELPQMQIETYLRYLETRPEISATELEFLAEYFYNRMPLHPVQQLQQMLGGGPSPGPFGALRARSFSNFVMFLDARYQDTPLGMRHFSVLHNNDNFAKLRQMYVDNRITYAHTEIADPLFYAAVAAKFPAAKTWTVSISNIFDMNYGDHSFQSMQRYLANLTAAARATQQTPVTVFRTTNFQPPHGFYRYEIKTPADIPKLDEVDSQARQEHLPRSAGF
ncbi:hypothetical protein BH10BDE1_BH10BDE1_21710 [soil metagenome]